MSSNQAFRVDSDTTKAEFLHFAEELYEKHRHVVFTWNTGKQRTLTQNAALHMWLGWVAKALNDAGFDMKKTLKHEAEIPWTMESAKRALWKPIQEVMLNKSSTTEAERQDYSEIEKVLSRHLQQRTGVTIPPWPKKKDKL